MADEPAQLSPLDMEPLRVLPRFFNKAGIPIGLLEWGRLFEDHSYQQILSTTVRARGGPEGASVRVQTIWSGSDPDMFVLPRYKPRIFHTAVWSSANWPTSFDFDRPEMLDEYGWRTLEEAWRGHFELVEEWERRLPESLSVMDWRHHPRIAAMGRRRES